MSDIIIPVSMTVEESQQSFNMDVDEQINVTVGTDVSDTTAIEADVVSGKKFHKSNGDLATGSLVVPVWSCLGANPVKVMDIAETETALSATGFNTWTPSTTAATIVNSSDVGTLELDMENYDYVLLWFFDVKILYDGSEENRLKINRQCQCVRQELYRTPNSLSQIEENDYSANRSGNMFISALMDYYSSTGNNGLAYTQSSGIYPSYTAQGLSSSTSDTPTLTVKTPIVKAQCSTSYLSTANASKIDKSNSKYKLRGEVWRVDKRGVLGEMYKNIVDMYNA